jgi:hypothetical protein
MWPLMQAESAALQVAHTEKLNAVFNREGGGRNTGYSLHPHCSREPCARHPLTRINDNLLGTASPTAHGDLIWFGRLRNKVIHFEPEWHSIPGAPSKMEDILPCKFAASRFFLHSPVNPYLPDRWLGYDCLRWGNQCLRFWLRCS